MGGLFGVASREDCVKEVFFGTDYHSHLGTVRGGMAVKNREGISKSIHDITNTQFRTKFEDDLAGLHGNTGIGVISDFDDQPLIIGSHLGIYGIATVGAVQNAASLAEKAFGAKTAHFSEMMGSEINPTELIAVLINDESGFVEGIRSAQQAVEGSCSMLLLTDAGIYAARDRLGRTPLILGKRDGAVAATSESCALPNLGFEIAHSLGPGEIVLLTPDGFETMNPPGDRMQICSFLWVYYGYPASSYEGINVEVVRNRCGAALARRDDVDVDLVAGIPDSGTAHALGYANQAKRPYRRPFVKYTPTWPRSFMPQDQGIRDLVARMKLIPIRDLIEGRRLLFCEDSIVRGTQLRGTIKLLKKYGAKAIHMRPACPPLIHGCKFLNFSRSRSELELAGRKAIQEMGADFASSKAAFADPDSPEYAEMVERIRGRLDLTSLQYQRLPDLVEAIGLPKEKLCTFCFDGAS